MSSYRSLHREQLLDTAIWSVEASPVLKSKTNSSHSWRIWTASSDGLIRGYIAEETSIDSKKDTLDASALSLQCTHVLLGEKQAYPAGSTVLGCTRVDTVRSYVGSDTDVGDFVVLSLELAGKVRVWSFSETLDEGETTSEKQIRALNEFEVENATGTTASICPPRVAGVGNVVVAVGCLDGTISIVATGLVTPKATKEAKPAGQLVDSWGSRGSSVPLSLCWHPVQSHSLAVGRQDGVVDILTSNGKNHRFSMHHTPVRAVTFTDDGHLLIAGSDEGMITIWDCSRKIPALVHHVLQAHKSWILDITPLPDSRRFVTAGADQTLHVWNVGEIYQAVHTFQTDHTVWSMQRVSAEQPRLVTGSESGWLQVFSLER